jgi:hypothetical protein
MFKNFINKIKNPQNTQNKNTILWSLFLLGLFFSIIITLGIGFSNLQPSQTQEQNECNYIGDNCTECLKSCYTQDYETSKKNDPYSSVEICQVYVKLKHAACTGSCKICSEKFPSTYNCLINKDLIKDIPDNISQEEINKKQLEADLEFCSTLINLTPEESIELLENMVPLI